MSGGLLVILFGWLRSRLFPRQHSPSGGQCNVVAHILLQQGTSASRGR